MHDIKRIRENPSELDNNLKRRGLKPASEEILKTDKELRECQTYLQGLYKKHKDISNEIFYLKESKKIDELDHKIEELQKLQEEHTIKLNSLLDHIPVKEIIEEWEKNKK